MVWAAHSYNGAFAGEIGHFEYCNAVVAQAGDCAAAGVSDPGGVDAVTPAAPGIALPRLTGGLASTLVQVGAA